MTALAKMIQELEAEQRKSKNEFLTLLDAQMNIINNTETPLGVRKDALLAVYAGAVEHLNLMESLVSQDEISGAATVNRWRIYRAETALSILDFWAEMFASISEIAGDLGMAPFRPSPRAYASLQRLATEECPDESAQLMSRFQSLGLPIHGFQRSTARNQLPPSSAEVNFSGNISGSVLQIASPHAKSTFSQVSTAPGNTFSQEEWANEIARILHAIVDRVDEVEHELWDKAFSLFKRVQRMEVQGKSQQEVLRGLADQFKEADRIALKQVAQSLRSVGESMAASGVVYLLTLL